MSNALEEIDNVLFLNSLKNLGNKPIATELHHMHDERYKMPKELQKVKGWGVSRDAIPKWKSVKGDVAQRTLPGSGTAGTLPLVALLMSLIQGTTKSEGQDKTPFQEMGGNIADWLVPTGEGTVPEVDLYSLLDSPVTGKDEALYEEDLQQRKGMDFRNLLNMIGGVPKGVR
jgi:hypothetical protein